jgi:hypothetical protein
MLIFLLTLAVAVLSVARTARLIVFDEYPPMMWLRERWDRILVGNWGKLIHCGFCAAPYLAAGMAVWFLWVTPWGNPGDYWSADWWFVVVNGTWGLSYLASITVAYDQPE